MSRGRERQPELVHEWATTPPELLPDPVRPASGASRWVAVAAAAVLLVGAGAGTYWFTQRDAGHSTVVGSPELEPAPSDTGAPAVDPSVSVSLDAGVTDTTEATPTDELTQTPSDTVTDSTEIGSVQLGPGLVGDAAAEGAASTLSAFFTAITEQRLSDAYALYTDAEKGKLGDYATWAAGYSTTRYDGIVLDSVDPPAGDEVVAHVRFRSHQDPSQAPDQLSECVTWALVYRLVPGGGGTAYVIDNVKGDVPAGEQAFQPCG